jgi:hypothetical protein
MSLRPRPGLNGQQILAQMCQRCHNSRLDQTITRAKFDVSRLAQMSREEKDLAIFRIQLGATNKLKMPPDRFGTLSPAEIQLVADVLRQ